MTLPTVLFQITAIGKNPRALDTSARSVLYWLRRTPRLGFRAEIWAVVEPEGYATAPELYERLAADGVRIVVVPASYATPLGTSGKARALEYAVERRVALRRSGPRTWVYHQDEETVVGQDTLLGIADFVAADARPVGAGIILYPVDWTGSASHIQELTRSYDDLRVLDSMTLPGNPTAGFHGSHILVRSNVEDAVGWDTVGYSPAEDLTFEIRVRARFGSAFGVLKGFAYEKGAFSLRDQLRQRRRWMHGVLFALRRAPELSVRRRIALGYSALSWYAALPSVLVLAASVTLRYGPILLGTSVFTGFIWVSMATGYLEGYRLHAEYVRRRISYSRLVGGALLGALVDVLAPWFALVTRPSRGDFIPKDRPLEDSRPSAGRPLAD
ncbi:Glycosyltransferase [mine drainage metagenome]|uniref:Glycosyltransferase n=2 Tax=mine drainage metagenome TaxID=410659 RepID=T0ZLB7_9ZZZZ